jgi:hypothetical protein
MINETGGVQPDIENTVMDELAEFHRLWRNIAGVGTWRRPGDFVREVYGHTGGSYTEMQTLLDGVLNLRADTNEHIKSTRLGNWLGRVGRSIVRVEPEGGAPQKWRMVSRKNSHTKTFEWGLINLDAEVSSPGEGAAAAASPVGAPAAPRSNGGEGPSDVL